MLILALVAIACLSTMAQKRAVTIPDVYRITSVSSVGLSPDAKQLVYSVGNTSLQTLKSDLCRQIGAARCKAEGHL